MAGSAGTPAAQQHPRDPEPLQVPLPLVKPFSTQKGKKKKREGGSCSQGVSGKAGFIHPKGCCRRRDLAGARPGLGLRGLSSSPLPSASKPRSFTQKLHYSVVGWVLWVFSHIIFICSFVEKANFT